VPREGLRLLAGDPGVHPLYHSFVGSKAPWDELPENGPPRYEGRNPNEV
jgi:hypothetical protein